MPLVILLGKIQQERRLLGPGHSAGKSTDRAPTSLTGSFCWPRYRPRPDFSTVVILPGKIQIGARLHDPGVCCGKSPAGGPASRRWSFCWPGYSKSADFSALVILPGNLQTGHRSSEPGTGLVCVADKKRWHSRKIIDKERTPDYQ